MKTTKRHLKTAGACLVANDDRPTIAADVVNWLSGLRRLAESTDSLDELTATMENRVAEQVPGFRDDPTLRGYLRASCRSNWKGFLEVVGRPEKNAVTSPATYDFARTLARRGYELPALITAYQVAQRGVWEFVDESLRASALTDGDRLEALRLFWGHSTHWLDTIIQEQIATFTREREAWQRGSLARQAATVGAILDGGPINIDGAEEVLNYQLSSHHVAFTIRVDESIPGNDVQPRIEGAAKVVASSMHSEKPLIISNGSRSAWCWSTAADSNVNPANHLDENPPAGVWITIGSNRSGIDGFRISHKEAAAAVAVADRRQLRVARFADVGLSCLAMGTLDCETARAFVTRELGELAAADEPTTRLRETVRVYLSLGGDVTAAAETLVMHPNTVRYRIRQAERKIGHPIQQRRVQVEMALEIIDILDEPPDSRRPAPE